MNIPERIKHDPEKVEAFKAGYGEPSNYVMPDAGYRQEERWQLNSIERKLLNCYRWGQAQKDLDHRQKYGSGPHDFHPSSEERERIGSLDAYEYMMRLPRLMGIPPANKFPPH